MSWRSHWARPETRKWEGLVLLFFAETHTETNEGSVKTSLILLKGTCPPKSNIFSKVPPSFNISHCGLYLSPIYELLRNNQVILGCLPLWKEDYLKGMNWNISWRLCVVAHAFDLSTKGGRNRQRISELKASLPVYKESSKLVRVT